MTDKMYQISTDLHTIDALPEFAFEAKEVYKQTLDLNKAITEAQRMSAIQKAKEEARQNGYVTTLFGRRRYLADINSANATVRGFAERNAINAPIQGTAADIIKVAMIRIHNRFKAENIRSKMILQVHDELIVEAPEFEAMRVAMLLQEEMENAAMLNVPLVAEAKVGKTWYDAKD